MTLNPFSRFINSSRKNEGSQSEKFKPVNEGGGGEIEVCLLWNLKSYLFEVLFSGARPAQKNIITQIYEACLSNRKGYKTLQEAGQSAQREVCGFKILFFQKWVFGFICDLTKPTWCTLTMKWLFSIWSFSLLCDHSERHAGEGEQVFDGTKDEDAHLVGCNKMKDTVNILE